MSLKSCLQRSRRKSWKNRKKNNQRGQLNHFRQAAQQQPSYFGMPIHHHYAQMMQPMPINPYYLMPHANINPYNSYMNMPNSP